MKKINFKTNLNLSIGKLLIRGLILLILNNIILFLMFWPESQPAIDHFKIPKNYSEILISASLKVPFKKYIPITLTDLNILTFSTKAFLIDKENDDEGTFYKIAVPSNKITEVIKLSSIHILPGNTHLKTPPQKGKTYEIHY